MAELRNWLLPMNARETVLILDTCYAAASVQDGVFRPAPLGDASLGQLAYDKRMRILAAAEAVGYANESRVLEGSLLTYALVDDGIRKRLADWKPRDGVIGMDEWLEFALVQVPRLYTRLRNGPQGQGSSGESQRPQFFNFGGNPGGGITLAVN